MLNDLAIEQNDSSCGRRSNSAKRSKLRTCCPRASSPAVPPRRGGAACRSTAASRTGLGHRHARGHGCGSGRQDDHRVGATTSYVRAHRRRKLQGGRHGRGHARDGHPQRATHRASGAAQPDLIAELPVASPPAAPGGPEGATARGSAAACSPRATCCWARSRTSSRANSTPVPRCCRRWTSPS